MSKFFVATVVFARLFAGAAIAEDYPDRNGALSLDCAV